MTVVEQIPMPPQKGLRLDDRQARDLLRRVFDAAVAAADPARVLPAYLPEKPMGRCIVVGAGKAAAAMASAVEAAWPDVEMSGCVVAPYGYGKPCRQIGVREAGHPVPDESSVLAAQEIIGSVQGLSPQDLVLALISGGGSASMCLPSGGLSLEDKQAVNRLLLASGLDIRTMNAVRRRMSAIKGGRLAAAASPARVVTLAISDIPGDDLAAIASGPTAADQTADMDLSAIVERLGPGLPEPAASLLSAPGRSAEVPSAEPIRVIASAGSALSAAAEVAAAQGVTPLVLGDDIEGEARLVAEEMAGKALAIAGPVVLISGGETTVTIPSGTAGRGGRNTEFMLALACALEGRASVWALAADTDGLDGTNLDAAGAIIGPDTLARAVAAGLDPQASLDAHDSGSFFAALGDLVVTGPTLTNVNDFRAILVLPQVSG